MSFKSPTDKKEYQHWYYQTHKEERKEIRKRWVKSEKGHAYSRKVSKIARDKVKEETFAHYGNKCTCCGETKPIFLVIDHINNDGKEHRKTIGSPRRGGTNTYYWAKRNNYPKTLQVLCFNCNWAKAHGGCPHQNSFLEVDRTQI